MSRVERVEKQETLAEIVAEMRRKSQEFFPDLPIAVLQLASRIEAAWKREREDLNPSGRGAAKTRGQKASARRAAESCLGTGEAEQYNTVQIGGKMSGGGRAEANRRGTATAGAAPEPAKSFGDAAAMREAAESALIVVRGIIDGTLSRRNQSVFDCRDKLKSALSAPPRNCDVGTARQQEARFVEACRPSLDCYVCKLGQGDCDCRFHWAQMPCAGR